MRLLSVGLGKDVVKTLKDTGMVIEEGFPDRDDFARWFADGAYDVGVIDLEGASIGTETIRKMRREGVLTPLVGVHKRLWAQYAWPSVRAEFLESGGDDLLQSPADPRELIATLCAISRRQRGSGSDIHSFSYEGAELMLSLSGFWTRLNGEQVCLTPKEQQALFALASRPGKHCPKEYILGHMYALGTEEEPLSNTIDVMIGRLRKKFRDIHPDGDKLIRTQRGVGYQLVSR